MSDADLIRRGDVLATVFSSACSVARRGEPCLHPRCEATRESALLATLHDLPADPVADAALALAEAMDSGEYEVGDRWQPFHIGNQATHLLAAYRAARATAAGKKS